MVIKEEEIITPTVAEIDKAEKPKSKVLQMSQQGQPIPKAAPIEIVIAAVLSKLIDCMENMEEKLAEMVTIMRQERK